MWNLEKAQVRVVSSFSHAGLKVTGEWVIETGRLNEGTVWWPQVSFLAICRWKYFTRRTELLEAR